MRECYIPGKEGEELYEASGDEPDTSSSSDDSSSDSNDSSSDVEDEKLKPPKVKVAEEKEEAVRDEVLPGCAPEDAQEATRQDLVFRLAKAAGQGKLLEAAEVLMTKIDNQWPQIAAQNRPSILSKTVRLDKPSLHIRPTR